MARLADNGSASVVSSCDGNGVKPRIHLTRLDRDTTTDFEHFHMELLENCTKRPDVWNPPHGRRTPTLKGKISPQRIPRINTHVAGKI